MSKSLKYIILITLLLITNLWLFFSDSMSRQDSSSKYFDSEDLSAVSRIQFDVDNEIIKLELTGKGWILNESFKADEGFVNTLLSVLQRVEVGRTFENLDQDVIGAVEVEFDFNSRYRFQFASNPTQTKSYFISNGKTMEVAVPGYRDNVIDFFTLHPDQWRERLIFDGTWRTIQRVLIESVADESIEIKFDEKFFLVNGNQPNDSTSVINYLNQFEYFQANEMISEGRFPEFDSLSQTIPMAKITLDDIKSDEPTVLSVFPRIGNQQYHLMVKDGEERMVVDARRVSQILTGPAGLK
ncbi:hypothetical protein [Ekhidna sp.]|uniref:hypothetical protein n=1 Tax=Ekhidna sp. TaxID=2608089 RepID=UPI00329A5D44